MNLLDLLISPAVAQAAAQPGAPNPWTMPIMLILFFAVFYFFIIRPQSKRAKEHRAMLGALAKGDEVVTAGGIVGRVDAIGDAFVTVEVSDGVKIRLQKHAISTVLPKGTLKAS
jgi:preprotein translocase subunit YajC